MDNQLSFEPNVKVAATFDGYISCLRNLFPYVEDDSFKWDDVIAILVLQLSNTDSLNKASKASHASQIQITSERDPSPGMSKTEDFFPSLSLNMTFKSWRIKVEARIHSRNLTDLDGNNLEDAGQWKEDSLQIRRRLLNALEDNTGNPNLQICYGDDLRPLRERLEVNDYLIFVKRKQQMVYEAFGVKSSTDLGKGKKIYICAKPEEDATVFTLPKATLNFTSGYECNLTRNRILFGAPGTGKSFILNKEMGELLAEGGMSERVTFHPDYSYAHFVGTYKPVQTKDDDNKDTITYEYVPGPFMRVYVAALKSSRTTKVKPCLLIIEEINRANVAAVFGDVFQLLDRDKNISEYPIMPSKDIKEYLARPDVLGGEPEDYKEICIPDNMFLWATMNSADQGVYPMDTAFKRRWDFTYLGIDDSESDMDERIKNREYVIGSGDKARLVKWNDIRRAINDVLSSENYNINEDKLLGPYFVSKAVLLGTEENFISVFKNKVIMYLFDDAVKQKKTTFFEKCRDDIKGVRYSDICKKFDSKGVFIFPDEISKRFTKKQEIPVTVSSEETEASAE